MYLAIFLGFVAFGFYYRDMPSISPEHDLPQPQRSCLVAITHLLEVACFSLHTIQVWLRRAQTAVPYMVSGVVMIREYPKNPEPVSDEKFTELMRQHACDTPIAGDMSCEGLISPLPGPVYTPSPNCKPIQRSQSSEPRVEETNTVPTLQIPSPRVDVVSQTFDPPSVSAVGFHDSE